MSIFKNESTNLIRFERFPNYTLWDRDCWISVSSILGVLLPLFFITLIFTPIADKKDETLISELLNVTYVKEELEVKVEKVGDSDSSLQKLAVVTTRKSGDINSKIGYTNRLVEELKTAIFIAKSGGSKTETVLPGMEELEVPKEHLRTPNRFMQTLRLTKDKSTEIVREDRYAQNRGVSKPLLHVYRENGEDLPEYGEYIGWAILKCTTSQEKTLKEIYGDQIIYEGGFPTFPGIGKAYPRMFGKKIYKTLVEQYGKENVFIDVVLSLKDDLKSFDIVEYRCRVVTKRNEYGVTWNKEFIVKAQDVDNFTNN